MKDFKKSNSFGGNRDRGGERPARSFDRPAFGARPDFARNNTDRPVVMHKATCADCGNVCEVPFRPNGEKPVYCNDCFGGKRDGGKSSFPRKEFNDRSDRAPKREWNDRPAPRTDFKPAAPVLNTDALTKQMSEISVKLDRLTNAIERMSQPKAETPVVKVAPIVAPKVAIKAEVKPIVKAKPAPKKKEVKVAVKKVVKKKK